MKRARACCYFAWLHFACLLVAFVSLPAAAQTTLNRCTPAALVPGKTTEITLSGAKLDDPLTIWTSFGAKVELVSDGDKPKSDRTQVKCRLTLDATTPVGIGGIVVAGPVGASRPLLVMVDDLPSVADNGANRALSSAQQVELPVAVDGATQTGTSDFYRFTAQPGEQVSIEVVAQRLGSACDPVVWLRDSKGRVLLSVDDDEALGADCRCSYTSAAGGEYIVEVRDNSFGNGQPYRLRLGDFPLVTTPFPLGGKMGSKSRLSFAGPAAESAAPIDLQLPKDASAERMYVAAKRPGGKSSGMAVLAVDELDEVVEKEPNDNADTATDVTLPGAINGRLAAAGDRDYFRFAAKKGDKFVFHAQAASLGSPTLLAMKLARADGTKLVETGVSQSLEESLAYTIPANGTYLVIARDLFGRGGPAHSYRIAVRRPQPGFSLAFKADANARTTFAVPKNGAFEVNLTCQRSGYDGPITLSVQGPGKYRLFRNVIGAKGKAAKMLVIAEDEPAAGDFRAVQIVGTATIDGKEVREVAATAAMVTAKTPQLLYPPAWIDGLVTVTGVGEVKPFYEAPLPADPLYLARGVGKTQFTLTPKRSDANFKTALTVLLDGLPQGFSYAMKIEGKVPKEKYSFTITGPKDAAAGSHKFELLSYGELKAQGILVGGPVVIQVVDPLKVSVPAIEAFAASEKRKVKVTIERFAAKGVSPEAVALKWKNLPAGVTAADATIAADKSEAEVEFSVAADAKPGKFDKLVVEASSKFQKQDVAVASEPVPFEIKPPSP